MRLIINNFFTHVWLFIVFSILIIKEARELIPCLKAQVGLNRLLGMIEDYIFMFMDVFLMVVGKMLRMLLICLLVGKCLNQDAQN